MVIDDLVHNTESAQYFLQPSIPDSSYEAVSPYNTVQHDRYVEEKNVQNDEVDDHIISSALKETLEEIGIKGKQLLKKIFCDGDMEIPLGMLAREAIGDSQAKDLLETIKTKVGKKMKAHRTNEGFVVAERGAGIDEELSDKLERFKVKTVNIGGVVKDDKK